MVWRDALRLLEFFPMFGCGIGAFAPAYWPYQRVVRFEYWPHMHNEYMQWMLEGGFLGILLAACVLRLAWMAAPRAFRDIAARPALAGLAAALTHALVDSPFRIPANAAWASLLFVCLILSSSGSGAGERPRRPA
jgi:O-antigen ligase